METITNGGDSTKGGGGGGAGQNGHDPQPTWRWMETGSDMLSTGCDLGCKDFCGCPAESMVWLSR